MGVETLYAIAMSLYALAASIAIIRWRRRDKPVAIDPAARMGRPLLGVGSEAPSPEPATVSGHDGWSVGAWVYRDDEAPINRLDGAPATVPLAGRITGFTAEGKMVRLDGDTTPWLKSRFKLGRAPGIRANPSLKPVDEIAVLLQTMSRLDAQLDALAERHGLLDAKVERLFEVTGYRRVSGGLPGDKVGHCGIGGLEGDEEDG